MHWLLQKMPKRLLLLIVFKHRLFSNPSTSSAFATEIALPFSHEISSTNTAIAFSNKLKSSLTSILNASPKKWFCCYKQYQGIDNFYSYHTFK